MVVSRLSHQRCSYDLNELLMFVLNCLLTSREEPNAKQKLSRDPDYVHVSIQTQMLRQVTWQS